MKTSGIYEIHNTLNGKRYVGGSTNLNYRRDDHFRRLARGAHANGHLQRAYDKYGKDAFEFRPLFSNVSRRILTRLEQAAMDVICPEYNIHKRAGRSLGNQNWLGRKHTEETKRKIGAAHKGRKATPEAKANMSRAQKGNKNHLGHKHSEEAKRKIGEASLGNKRWLGRKHTEETKQKMSAAKKGKPGHKHTEETKRKISTAQKGRVFSEEHRKKIGLAELGNKKHLGHKHSKETRHKLSQMDKKRERDALGRYK